MDQQMRQFPNPCDLTPRDLDQTTTTAKMMQKKANAQLLFFGFIRNFRFRFSARPSAYP